MIVQIFFLFRLTALSLSTICRCLSYFILILGYSKTAQPKILFQLLLLGYSSFIIYFNSPPNERMLDAGEIDDFRLILMYLKHNTYNYVIIL